MTYKEIAGTMDNIAGAAGLQVTYYQWPEGSAPNPPYLVWHLPSSANVIADDEVYLRMSELAVELYTDNKSPAIELAVEAALSEAGFVWEKEETYIDSEEMYEVLYTTEVIIDE